MASNSRSCNKMFIWSDEETALLLKITLEYKTSRSADGQDWETVPSKYEDIYKNFIAAYPNEEIIPIS